MMHTAMARLATALTRATFERKVGGAFQPVQDAPGRRTNGQWVTYRDASKQVAERTDCFCRKIQEGGPTYSGRTWTEVAKAMGL